MAETKPTTQTEIKPGVQTTELWFTVATTGLSLLVVYGVLNDQQAAAWLKLIGALLPLLPGMIYTLGRSYVKAHA